MDTCHRVYRGWWAPKGRLPVLRAWNEFKLDLSLKGQSHEFFNLDTVPGDNWCGWIYMVIPGVAWYTLSGDNWCGWIYLEWLDIPGDKWCGWIYLVKTGVAGYTWWKLVWLQIPGDNYWCGWIYRYLVKTGVAGYTLSGWIVDIPGENWCGWIYLVITGVACLCITRSLPLPTWPSRL